MELIKKYLLNNLGVEELKEMANSVNSYNGALDNLQYYENDEYFFKEMFTEIDEAVRAVCYGDYNYCDDMVKFNGYGNLESCNEYEYEQEIKEFKNEIVEEWLEIYKEDPDYLQYDEAFKILKEAETEQEDQDE